MNGNYVAAVYDFRSKQDYIYRTNRVQEIMGASKLIEGAYEEALKGYKEIDEKWDRNTKLEDCLKGEFKLSEFADAGDQGTVLYEGGGNLVLLFKSKEEFLAFNSHFSLWLIDNAPGLTPICGSAEIDVNGKFREETAKVFADLGRYKRLASPLLSDTVLPITQVDRRISQPVVNKEDRFGAPESLSAESVKKLDSYSDNLYWEEESDKRFARNFDNLVEKKGTESLLAILYVDGNGMGERVKAYIPEDKTFETGVNLQRELTQRIKKAFVDDPIQAIKDYLTEQQEKYEKKRKEYKEQQKAFPEKIFAMRRIIGGGDEITIVCNARHALEIADVYFKNLDPNYSACMGIAIFHAHAPFAMVYEIAEQCCESGKKRMKKNGVKDGCYIDAHFCFGAITGTLDAMRGQIGEERTCMPYCVNCELERFKALGNELGKIKRSNVKALRDAAFRSQADFEMELMRVKSNCAGFAIKETDRAMLCDVCTFYDLWFGGETNG